MISHEFLNDTAILRYIDNLQLKTQYLKIVVLDKNEVPLRAIEGRATGGSVNINANSAVRRSCNLSLVTEYKKTESDPLNILHEVTNIKTLISMNKRVAIEVGIQNSGSMYKDYHIFWFPLGVFMIEKPAVTYDMNGIQISLSLIDKMALLNGQSGGTFTSPTVFSPIEQIDGSEEPVPFEEIIYSLLQLWLGTNNTKYHIEIPKTTRAGVKWNGKMIATHEWTKDPAQSVCFVIDQTSLQSQILGAYSTEVNMFLYDFFTTSDSGHTKIKIQTTKPSIPDDPYQHIVVHSSYASIMYQNYYSSSYFTENYAYTLPLPIAIDWDVDVDVTQLQLLTVQGEKWYYQTADKQGTATGTCTFSYQGSEITGSSDWYIEIDAGLLMAAEPYTSSLAMKESFANSEYLKDFCIVGKIPNTITMIDTLKKGKTYNLDSDIKLYVLDDITESWQGKLYITILDQQGTITTSIGALTPETANLAVYSTEQGLYTSQPISQTETSLWHLSRANLLNIYYTNSGLYWLNSVSATGHTMHTSSLQPTDSQQPMFLFNGSSFSPEGSLECDWLRVTYTTEQEKYLAQSLKTGMRLKIVNAYIREETMYPGEQRYEQHYGHQQYATIKSIKIYEDQAEYELSTTIWSSSDLKIYLAADFYAGYKSQLQTLILPFLSVPLGAYFNNIEITEENKTNKIEQLKAYPYNFTSYCSYPTDISGSEVGRAGGAPAISLTSDGRTAVAVYEVYRTASGSTAPDRSWVAVFDFAQHIVSYYDVEDRTFMSNAGSKSNILYSAEEILQKTQAHGTLKAVEPEMLLTQQSINNKPHWCYIPRNLKTVILTGPIDAASPSLPDHAFENCSQITTVALRDDTPALGKRAFYGTGIKRFVVPSHVKEIKDEVFAWCTDLTAVTLPTGLERVYNTPFAQTPKLQTIYYLGTENEWANVRGEAPLVEAAFDNAPPEIPATAQLVTIFTTTDKTCGYKEVPFVFPMATKLSAQAGDTVVTILDKIKDALGNYEYFFDVEGVFHFREIKNYLNDGSSNSKLGDAINEKYFIVTDKNKIVYEFTDANLITAYNHNPNYQMIKNDFNIWGQHSDTKQPLWYHLRFMKLPAAYEYRYWRYNGYKYVQSNLSDELGTIDLKDNWRKKLYFLAQEKEPEDRTSFDIELLDNLMQMYDPNAELWDPDAQINTQGLYFFDAINTDDLLLMDRIPIKSLDVDEIGCQAHVLQNDKINCFFSSLTYENLYYNFTSDLFTASSSVYLPKLMIDYCLEEVAATDNPAYDVLRGEIHKYLSYNENITITCMPIYHLDVNQRIRVDNDESDIHGDYVIQSISLPLGVNGMMQITAQKAIERI